MKLILYSLCLSLLALSLGCAGGTNGNARATKDAPPSTNGQAARKATPSPYDNFPKIVAFGDSLTAGYGLSPAESYPALLQKKLDADGFKYEVVNAGISGDTSAAGLRRIDWSLEGDVRFLILELGANDFLRGQPVGEARNNLEQIIRRAQGRGVTVLLAGMYTTTNAGRDYQREIQEAFQTLAREQKVTLIPFFLEGVAGIEALNQEDRIHPNAEGTKIVADTVYRYLKPLLEKERR